MRTCSGVNVFANIAPVMTNTLNFSARRNLPTRMIVRIEIERNLALSSSM